MQRAALRLAPLMLTACLTSGALAAPTRWRVDVGLSARDLEARAGEMRGEGLVPVSLSANGTRISAVWAERGATDWELTVSEGVDARDEQLGRRRDAGWRPLVLCSWEGPGFAVVWLRDTTKPDDWDLTVELTPDEYQAVFDQRHADGMRPVGICAYGEGDEARIGAAWVCDGLGLDAAHDLPSDWLPDRLLQGRRQGARLLQVAVYGSPAYPYLATTSVREAQRDWEDDWALTPEEFAEACEA